jgi:hypothetical protein
MLGATYVDKMYSRVAYTGILTTAMETGMFGARQLLS